MLHDRNKEPLWRSLAERRHVRWTILVIVTMVFAAILYPGLMVGDHAYQVGDVVERDIKAPVDFLIEDSEATAANRKAAEDSALTVYDYDTSIASGITGAVAGAFADMAALIEADRARAAEAAARQRLEPPGPVPSTEASPSDSSPAAPASLPGPSLSERLWARKAEFENRLGIPVNKGAFDALVKADFAPQIADRIIRIVGDIMAQGVVANKEVLLRETERGIVLRIVGTESERPVTNVRAYYGLPQAKEMVRIVGQPFLEDVSYARLNLIVDIAQRLLQPDITLNRNESQKRRNAAAAEVKPVLHKIKAGEMLLREGERVTAAHLLKLKALQAAIQDQTLAATSIGAALLLLGLLVCAYVLNSSFRPAVGGSANKDLFFLACLLILFFILAEVSVTLCRTLAENSPFAFSAASIFYGTPIPSAAMIVCLFLGLEIALPVAIILSVCVAILFQGQLETFVFFALSSCMAAYWIRDCRERKVFIKAGLKIGLLNMALATAVSVYTADIDVARLAWSWLFGMLGGLGTGIVAAGVAPMMEIFFGYTSDIKLLELANLDQPILRKLLIEAPGTYHHSVIVGNMVEAAASEIGANPLLAKVCGYYHDIGKIKKPAYFIENQTDGKNRHDKLAPSMSALILIAHLKEGVEMAKANKLGQVIIDTIRQHHGTSLIRFFYEKAKQQKGEDNVNIDNYRYPGPKPQTREAGLVMLADVVEAASRSLDNPTPSRIQGLVQRLINTIFSDGQLDNCELTLKDLHKIAKIFNTILTGIHHHRIEYPEKRPATNERWKTKDGNPDRQPPRKDSDPGNDDHEERPDHLRRLGLS
jgi:putative nucleotidyltransferase with HDIG domain